MGLTQKILLFTSALVVALVATSLAYTTAQANRLARATIDQALKETREVWETFQADRYNKLKLGVRVLANDPYFKAAIKERHYDTTFDSLRERGQDLAADFMIATDPEGVVVARSDRPGAQGDDLSQDPIAMKPMEGEDSATLWRQGDELFNAVAVPMLTGPDFVGVLIAGYAIDEGVASQIRKVTHSEIAYLVEAPGQPTRLAVSSLGPKEPALKTALAAFAPAAAGDAPFELDLAAERYIGVRVPLEAATGEVVGSALALRSLAEETAAFRRFRDSLILVSLVVMAIGLGLAYVSASRITGPVRKLVDLVERARDGSFSGAVSVGTSDEIGTLARSFNALLADLREKDQMISFLREGMTLLKKGAGATGQAKDLSVSTTATTATLSAGAVTAPARVEKGSVFGGRYEILDTVGKGGMGVVYRARDTQLDEVVALKVLRNELLLEDRTLLDRFKLEIKLARRITHRNVLRTHDFGEAEGTPYISMEYLEGVTLKELLRRRGALPAGIGLSIAKQMCHGLEAAHQQGVVHRDIKPHNMLILPETGELKIMDFGIARVSEVKGEGGGGLTSAGTVMGTPDYMPPEQAMGQPADFRSDIYSLGVVLFETFTGSLPFRGETIMDIVQGHIQTPPPRPRNLNPHLREDIEGVILRCLEKAPARRYGKVSELLADLTAISGRVEAAA
jgi:serine/threonine-protein kinase